MLIDPTRSTIVAWYDPLPDGLAQLVVRVQAQATGFLGAAFTTRDPAQVHATVIGLERAAAPFDPGPVATHLGTVLARPLTIQFGGFAPTERRLRSRGLPLHERGFSVRHGRVVLMGWPVDGDAPCAALADLRRSCGTLGVTHRYGDDPDVYLVIGDVAGKPDAAALEAIVRADLAAAAVRVPLAATDLCLVRYHDPALPRASTSWTPLAAC